MALGTLRYSRLLGRSQSSDGPGHTASGRPGQWGQPGGPSTVFLGPVAPAWQQGAPLSTGLRRAQSTLRPHLVCPQVGSGCGGVGAGPERAGVEEAEAGVPCASRLGPGLAPSAPPRLPRSPPGRAGGSGSQGPTVRQLDEGLCTGPQMCSVLRRHQQAPRPSPLAGSRLPPPCSLCQCDDSSRGRVQAASVRSLSAEPAGRAHSRPMAGRSPPQPRLAFVRCALPACPQPALGAVRFRATGEPPFPLHPALCLGPRWLCVLAWARRRQVEREGQGQVGDVGQEPCPTRASCPQAAAVIPSRVGRRARRRLGPGRARRELGSRCNLENPAASSPHLGRWGSDGQQLQDPRPHSRVAARRQAGLCSSGTC